MNNRKFGVMYSSGGCGVIEYVGDHNYIWVMESMFTETQAKRMIDLLKQNPELNRDELLLLLEAA